MKATLTHIGVVSLGRMLAIWSFVLGLIGLVAMTVFLLLMMLLGMAASESPAEVFGGGLIGLVLLFVVGVVALLVNGVIAFVVGALMAIVYNIILGVGGGIDLDLKSRE